MLYDSLPVPPSIATFLEDDQSAALAITQSSTGPSSFTQPPTQTLTYSLSLTSMAAAIAAGYSRPGILSITRLVTIVDGCSSPEFTCMPSLLCSYLGGRCDGFNLSTPFPPSVVALTAPKIAISGSRIPLFPTGSSFSTAADGTRIYAPLFAIFTTVEVGSGAYSDLGATAVSAGGADLSADLLACGSSGISTVTPTDLGSVQVVMYLVWDANGNVGNQGYRFVQVRTSFVFVVVVGVALSVLSHGRAVSSFLRCSDDY